MVFAPRYVECANTPANTGREDLKRVHRNLINLPMDVTNKGMEDVCNCLEKSDSGHAVPRPKAV